MKRRGAGISIFLGIVCFVLIATAAIKIIGSFSHQIYMTAKDPLFGFLNRRQILLCAAVLELLCAILIIKRKTDLGALWLTSWLSCVFGVYRLALWLLGERNSICPCLGYWLPLKYSIVNKISLGIYVFLLVGSIVGLSFHYLKRDRDRSN